MTYTMATWEPWLAKYVPYYGRCALDIGANQGQWAAHLSPRFDRVISFEANPELAKRIRELLLPRVEVVEKAVWCEAGKVAFDIYGDSPHGYAIHSGITAANPHTGEHTTIEVEAVTLDSMEFGNVDLIKIDVEGAEVQVLKGAEQTILTNRPKLIVECHGHMVLLRTWLESIGYNVLLVHGPGYAPGDDGWASHCWLVAEWWQ